MVITWNSSALADALIAQSRLQWRHPEERCDVLVLPVIGIEPTPGSGFRHKVVNIVLPKLRSLKPFRGWRVLIP
jgi:hypothetical protein